MPRIKWNALAVFWILISTRELIIYFQIPVAPPYQPKPYENLQQILEYDNGYDEPMALPVKYQYPRHMVDERRKRAAANKNLFRWVWLLVSLYLFVHRLE